MEAKPVSGLEHAGVNWNGRTDQSQCIDDRADDAVCKSNRSEEG